MIINRPYSQYNEAEILKLYDAVGWTSYTNRPEMLEKAYSHSLYILGAYDGDDLVGITRVTGDGYSMIYIQDIIVLPDYQRKGIGTQLLKDVLSHYPDVYQTILLTENEEKTMKFYESVGFEADYKFGCIAFAKFNYDSSN